MDARPGNLEVDFWKDTEFWKSMFKLAGRLVMLATIVLGGASAADEITHSDLKTSEAKAATVDNLVVESTRETDVAYEEYYDLLRYHDRHAAACDSALEGFARHREDERDWTHVLEECHSEGGINGP
jgi:hypothetical protein